MTQLVLGGIAVALHAGAPDVQYGYAGGATDVVLSDGRPVRMRHWNKRLITITGSGWMATGLDALDWDAEHELLSPVPLRVSGTGPALALTADSRPDVAATALALVGEDWRPTGVTVSGRSAMVTSVTGATLYTVAWFPKFAVLCDPPDDDYSAGTVTWQLICREV